MFILIPAAADKSAALFWILSSTFSLIAYLAIFCFIMTTCADPGYVPENAVPLAGDSIA